MIGLLGLICHQEGVFQGLIPILNCYLENMEVDVDTRCTILNYLKLIKKRASGKSALLQPDVTVAADGRFTGAVFVVDPPFFV